MFRKTKPALTLLALFVLPYFLLIAYFSYFDKDIIYLRGGGASWMVNPEDMPVVNGFPSDFPAVYEIVFDLPSPPASGWLKLTATNAFELDINGNILCTESETGRRNWKSPTGFDIQSFLKTGENYINVRVHSPRSLTALKSEGEIKCLDGHCVSLYSGFNWLVRSEKAFAPFGINGTPQVVRLIYYPSLIDKINLNCYWFWSFIIFGCAIQLLIIIGIFPKFSALVDGAFFRLIPRRWEEGHGKAFFRAIIGAIFLILAVMLYHNFLVYAADRSGDYQAHMDYYNHFLGSFRLPLATEGRAMYNPPGIYFVSAMLFRALGSIGTLSDVLRYAQLINTLSAFITVVIIFLAIRILIRDRRIVAGVTAVAAFLPMNIYKAPSISPENVNALLCSLSFYFWLIYAERRSARPLALAGFFTGLAFLTRWTALFIFLAIVAGLFYLAVRGGDRKRYLRDMTVYCGVIAAISGWYYLRNIIYLHSPFPSVSNFYLRQLPGYRDWHFFTSFTGLMINDPLLKGNVGESFFAGTYSTFWFDGQHLFLNLSSFKNLSFPFSILALALLPTVLMIRGAFRASVAEAEQKGKERKAFYISLLLASALSFIAYTFFNLNGPWYSAVKAFYILYCILPFMCFLGIGLKHWTARRGYVLTYLWFLSLDIAIIKVFYL